jgi:hypothetical protein
MKSVSKILLLVLLILSISCVLFACSDDEVVYQNIDTITVDEPSIQDGFLLSEFDIEKIILNVKYKDTKDEKGNVVKGEIVQIPATLSMVVAEDKAQLSISGTKTITLRYGKFDIAFVLKLHDDAVKKYKVVFLNEDLTSLGDAQYIVADGKAVQPTIPIKAEFDFLGWKDRETGEFSSFDRITKDTTLVAYYAEKAFTVTYFTKIINNIKEADDSVGGADLTPKIQQIATAKVPRGASAISYAPNIPIIQGYSNGRWADTNSMKEITTNMSFYAEYDQDSVQITFNYKKRDALAVDEVKTYYVNGYVNDEFDVEQQGFKFVGWETENGKAITFPYKVTNEMRFIAKYINLNEGNEGFSYKLNEEGKYIISNYDGAENVIVIPKTHQGTDVVGLSTDLFADDNVKEFVVSNDNIYFSVEAGVLYTKSKDRLLAYPNLKTDVNFSIESAQRKITSIADYAFINATNLTSVDLGNNLIDIGNYAFSNCSKLTSIRIPVTVTTIGIGAFKMEKASSLTILEFTLPSSVEKISDEAFYGLNRLKSLTIPASVTEIGSGVFTLCKSLENIMVDEDNKSFIISDGAIPDTNEKTFSSGGLYNIGFTTLYCYPANYTETTDTDLILHKDLEIIESGALSHTKIQGLYITSPSIELKIDSVVVPNLKYLRVDVESRDNFIYTAKSLGNYVPRNILVKNEVMYNYLISNEELRSKTTISIFDATAWEELKDFSNNFIYEYVTTTININGQNVEETTITILGGRNTTKDLIIPDVLGEISITRIAPYAFSEDDNIVNVRLPNAIVEIGEMAFAKMPNLKEFYFNDNLKIIGYRAFFDSANLAKVDFSNKVKIETLGVEAFYNTLWYLDEEDLYLTINNLLVKFNGYDINADIAADIKAEKIPIIEQIASHAFARKTNLTNVVLPSSLLKIGYQAFQNCTGLSEIVMPKSIVEIENKAFIGCDNLLLVTFDAPKNTSDNIDIAQDAFPGTATIRYAEGDEYLTLYYEVDEDETKDVRGTLFIHPLIVEDDANRKFAGWYQDKDFTKLISFPLGRDFFVDEKDNPVTDKRIYAKYYEASQGSEGFDYKLNDSGYTITGYTGKDNYVIIPQMYKNRRITTIEANAFRDIDTIQSIKFPYSMSSGIISSSITSVGENAFTGTNWFDNYLGDFIIINDVLIRYKGKAEIVKIPSSIKKIADGAFRDNIDVKIVIISDGVVSLGKNMFLGCTNLVSVVLSATIESIGDNAFANCTKLVDINFEIAKDLAMISSSALDNTGWLNNKIDDCIIINDILYKYQGVKGIGAEGKLNIMNGITQIADRAFENDLLLSIVYIPKSMQYIGNYSFAKSNINRVIIFPTSDLKGIGDHAFYDCRNLEMINLSVCSSLDYIGDYAFAIESTSAASILGSLNIPASLTDLGESVFENSGIGEIVFANGSKLKKLSNNAFRECYNLSSVIFNGSSALTIIGENAFYNCSSLSIFRNVNANIEMIEAGAFYNCGSLYTLDINTSRIKDIGNAAFQNMGYVNSFNQNMVTVGNILIKYKGNDTVVNVPSSITTIYDGAFRDNTQITTINFAESSKLTTINDYAFYNCIKLANINFPKTVKSVGNDVVYNTLWYQNAIRAGVEYITIGNTLIKYNGTAKQVIIPKDVTIINKDAFSDIELYNIEIGTQVTLIKEGAFDGIITPQVTYEKGRYLYVECKNGDEFSIQKANAISIYNSNTLFYLEGDNYIATATFILGIVDYYIFDDSTKAIEGSWSLTIQNTEPFEIEPNTVNEIYVVSNEAKEDYLLDIRWDDYISLIKVLKRSTVTLIIDAEIDSAPPTVSVDMIYEEITLSEIDENYVFVGWFFDENKRIGLQYPLKLNCNFTIYAKFVSYEEGTGGGFSRDNTNTEITSYNDSFDTKVVIPSKIGNYEITAITGSWAKANPPESYGTHIWDIDKQIYVLEPDEGLATHYYVGAFEGRSKIEVIYFANNSKITTIGANAFKDCTSLRKIVLPSSITLIEEGAFSGCTALTEIVFAANATVEMTIETRAFENCTALKSITFPTNITVWGSNAFAGCTNLVDIYMSDTEDSTVVDLSGHVPFDNNDGKLKIYVNSAVYNIYSTRWSNYKENLEEVTNEE